MIKNLDDILAAVGIEDVIKEFIPLERQGPNYKACCPFHDEKTASFTVNPAKGIYKCFGCGKGGRAVNFVMKYEGLTFVEAVHKIASIARMQVLYEKGDRQENFERARKAREEADGIRETLAAAYQLYYEAWRKQVNKRAKKLQFHNKTYSKTTAQALGLCISPNDNLLCKSKLPRADLATLGLIKESTKGGYYDAFKNRVIYPIYNQSGGIVSFTARALVDEKKIPKWLNGPESPIYNKSNELYGLNLAWKRIQEKHFAYLVEGASDFSTLYDSGVLNAVAPCGTGFTEAQARLLGRYTGTVILLYDGDAAGEKAAARSLEILLAQQIEVKIVLLPKEQDPASFIVEKKREGFTEYVDANTQDALTWRIVKEKGKGTFHERSAAGMLAARLLSKIDSKLLQQNYIRAIGKLLEVRIPALEQMVSEEVSKTKEPRTSRLSDEQQQEAIKYGIYRDQNKYFLSNGKGQGQAISNFVINPIMLIKARTQSWRIVTVINEYDDEFTRDISTDAFVMLTTLKKHLEAQGNFVFDGKEEHFLKVKKMIYENCPSCYPIFTMGYHKAGFWAWGNGIYHDGEFTHVDDYGMVRFNDTNYYLPAFSKINLNVKSDDPDETDNFEKDVIYIDKPKIKFEDWAALFIKVHKENGIIAFAWYLAAVYRDIIHARLTAFPHLNLFGPHGSGKNYLGDSLAAMYGIKRRPVHIIQGTDVAFYRRVAQVRNGISGYDEYSEKVTGRRSEALKGFFDGTGREKGKMTNDNKTTVSQVASSIVIMGQMMPNNDPALMERVVTCSFKERKANRSEAELGQKLKDLEATGALSQVTSILHDYRDKIKEGFYDIFDDIKAMIQKNIGIEVSARLLQSFSTLGTVSYILNEYLPLPYSNVQLLDLLSDRLKNQSALVKGSSELSGFWNLVEFLIEKTLLKTYEHFICEKKDSVKVKDDVGEGTSNKQFAEAKKLVFLRLNIAHNLYREYGRKQGVERILELNTLEYYLKISPAYIGKSRGKKFGDRALRCYIFDVEALPIDIPFTEFKDL